MLPGVRAGDWSQANRWRQASYQSPRRGLGALSKKNVTAWVSVSLFAVLLGWQYFAPVSIERAASFWIGSTRVQVVECLLPVLVLLNPRPANKALFWWGAMCLSYATLNGLAVGQDPQVSVAVAVGAYGPFVVLGLVPFSARHAAPLRAALTVMLIGLVAEVLMYASGVLSHPDIEFQRFGEMDRIRTTVGSATATGAVLLMLGVWLVELWGLNWKGFVAGWVSAIGIAATFSRGPMGMAAITCVAGGMAWVFAAKRTSRQIRRGLGVTGLAALSAAIVSLGGPLDYLSEAVRERFETGDSDTASRLARYQEAWETVTANPVLGVGTGEYYARTRYAETAFVSIGKTSPHNAYLLVLVENGIVGLVLFSLGLTWTVVGILRRWRSRPVTIAALVIAAVGMNTEVLYLEPEFGLLLAGLLAWLDRREDVQVIRDESARPVQ